MSITALKANKNCQFNKELKKQDWKEFHLVRSKY